MGKLISIVALTVVVSLALVLMRQRSSRPEMLPFEKGPIADVSWEAAGTPLKIECTVTDSEGLPVRGAELDFRNNSGGNPGMTDENGRASVRVAEHDLQQIKINGATVLNRSNAYRLGYPNVSNGLRVRVVMKRKTDATGQNGARQQKTKD